jgi:hypothetical protein
LIENKLKITKNFMTEDKNFLAKYINLIQIYVFEHFIKPFNESKEDVLTSENLKPI